MSLERRIRRLESRTARSDEESVLVLYRAGELEEASRRAATVECRVVVLMPDNGRMDNAANDSGSAKC